MQPRFRVGDRVRVLHLNKTGHIRIPFYVRGKSGTVTQLCGVFLNPEDLAVGNTAGPVVALYRVAFRQTDLWDGYQGSARDLLCIEIYDHWLTAA
jgi:nitrile hydratase